MTWSAGRFFLQADSDLVRRCRGGKDWGRCIPQCKARYWLHESFAKIVSLYYYRLVLPFIREFGPGSSDDVGRPR